MVYTSGRWLHRDEEQCASRYINFSFQELCKKVLHLCTEASHIISYEKKEGGYNKVFIFLLDNGKRIVARLPTRAAGPSTLTTNSEVATIAYSKHYTLPHTLWLWLIGYRSKKPHHDSCTAYTWLVRWSKESHWQRIHHHEACRWCAIATAMAHYVWEPIYKMRSFSVYDDEAISGTWLSCIW